MDSINDKDFTMFTLLDDLQCQDCGATIHSGRFCKSCLAIEKEEAKRRRQTKEFNLELDSSGTEDFIDLSFI